MNEAASATGTAAEWIVAAMRIPATPSRHRVAVWRELRRIGAVSIGQGVWAVPDVPACAEGFARVVRLAAEGDGEVLVMTSRGRTDADGDKLARLFTSAREEDWTEFIADCGKFVDEIAREIAKGKFTLAELDEEEHSLDRLRRWHRDLKKRDVFGVPSGAEAAKRLRGCSERLEEYADLVYAHVHRG